MEDKTVKETIDPTCPVPMTMVMANMTAVVERMTTAMTVITMIVITFTMTNIIVSQVILTHNLIAKAEIGAQVFHAVEAMHGLHLLARVSSFSLQYTFLNNK